MYLYYNQEPPDLSRWTFYDLTGIIYDVFCPGK